MYYYYINTSTILLSTTTTPRPSNCHFELHSEKKFAFLKKKNENIMGLCVTNYVTTLKQNVGLLAMLYKILYYPTTKYYTTHHDIYYYPPKKKCKVILLPWQKNTPLYDSSFVCKTMHTYFLKKLSGDLKYYITYYYVYCIFTPQFSKNDVPCALTFKKIVVKLRKYYSGEAI